MQLKKYKKKIKIGRILIILLFSSFYSAQKITIENKNDFPIEVIFLKKQIEIGSYEKKTIQEKNEITNIDIIQNKNKDLKINIPLFLNPQESLIIENNQNNIYFKGDKDSLHHYIFKSLVSDLFIQMGNYQKNYQKNDVNGMLKTSEITLDNVLKKIAKLNTPPLEKEDYLYKKIEKYTINFWLFSVLTNVDNENLGNTEKEIMLYYFNKYIKKEVNDFSCSRYEQYDIMRRYAKHKKELNLFLPKYDIVEKSEDDSVNQFLSKSCQAFYFKGLYNYLNHRKDPKAEVYEKILKEKFHN
ncbi:hypothetical protein [Chryseobacterium populi]|uniref:Uncharacterized protein n=1 Tax=Chryseobacterium populi TaxID=1144316 RepID=J2JKH4_9FLAO|nr:hypothetical protein [Chryseobacterium populi]EJL68395.1 hypothetical protein PMI13_03730 [Chryseobacterium populi]